MTGRVQVTVTWPRGQTVGDSALACEGPVELLVHSVTAVCPGMGQLEPHRPGVLLRDPSHKTRVSASARPGVHVCCRKQDVHGDGRQSLLSGSSGEDGRGRGAREAAASGPAVEPRECQPLTGGCQCEGTGSSPSGTWSLHAVCNVYVAPFLWRNSKGTSSVSGVMVRHLGAGFSTGAALAARARFLGALGSVSHRCCLCPGW